MDREIFYLESMQYVVSYPQKYKKGREYPVIIFLHGAGTRGNDISKLMTNPYFEITDTLVDFPFVTVAPLCRTDTWFDCFEDLKRLVLEIVNQEYTNKKKIYLMGASMGGYAAWQLGMSMPEIFAAMVPICGGGMYWNAGRLVHVPVWAFHGAKDVTVFPEETVKMVEGVIQAGGNAKMTIYPENGHDAWSDTYRDYEVYKWLLSKEKIEDYDLPNTYTGSTVYG